MIPFLDLKKINHHYREELIQAFSRVFGGILPMFLLVLFVWF